MENKKEKRRAIRIPLLSEKCKWKLMDGTDWYESKLIDFTKNGAFIHSTKSMPIKSYLDIFFQLPGDLPTIKVEGVIKWQRWAMRKKDEKRYELGFGVEFIDVHANLDKILDSYATYLRNKQIITVSKRIVEEFFKNVPPTIK